MTTIMGGASPYFDAMMRNRPGYKPVVGPRSWNYMNFIDPKYKLLGQIASSFGGMFGGGGGGAAGGGAGPLGAGGPMQIDTGIQPSGIYDPTSLQIARNQIRAQAPTALGSMARHTAPGVSSSIGTQSGIRQQQMAGRMGAEDAVQQAMLQARLANAQQLLGGQQAALQSGMGLAGGMLDRLGIGQNVGYGLQQQDLQRRQQMADTLFGLLNYV